MRTANMDDHDQPGVALPDPARRGFLKAAPLGALLVVAGGAAKATPVAAPTPGPAPKRGYHETAHIRQYYQTAAYW
jgi:hypothetical protein